MMRGKLISRALIVLQSIVCHVERIGVTIMRLS
jgi:hypothetical protein